jgi:hypothetical protein
MDLMTGKVNKNWVLEYLGTEHARNNRGTRNRNPELDFPNFPGFFWYPFFFFFPLSRSLDASELRGNNRFPYSSFHDYNTFPVITCLVKPYQIHLCACCSAAALGVETRRVMCDTYTSTRYTAVRYTRGKL